MNVTACVLTHNAIEHQRIDLLKDCIESLAVDDVNVIVVDNHSTDGTADYVRDWGGYCSTDRLTTCGHGTNLCARIAVGSGADLCVLSDDDMLWRDDWVPQLVSWWSAAPDEVVLTGCHIEPLYTWNKVRGRVQYGDVPALLRDSTGAASWSFRATDWHRIGPVPERQQGWGDVPVCQRLNALGLKVAQLDLCEHRGETSTWGNRTLELHGWDTAPALELLYSSNTKGSTA
jgi:glycosyltransferase involved in cell wall biosynthesis